MNRKALMILAGALSMISCEIVDYNPHNSEDIVIPEQRGDLYYSTVEYDPGYDWRKDTLGGMVDCKIVLYKEHEQIARIYVPAEEHQSTDCEMHNIFEGALYSIHYAGDKTVIKRDGTSNIEFDYDGPVERFIAHKGTVHSISITPGGKGWRYRQGAKVVMESSNGHLMGDLYIDNNQVCFAYAEKLVSSGSVSAYRYHFVADGVSEQLSLLPTVTDVLAVMRVNGTMNILEKEANINWPVWLQDGASMIISVEKSSGMRDYWFCVMGEEVYVHAQAKIETQKQTAWNDCFWTWGSLDYKTLARKQITAVCQDHHEMCFIATDNAMAGELEVVHAGKTFTLDNALIMPSPYSLCCSKSSFTVGLNDSSKKNRPVILDGADTVEMDFNGYFTHFHLP